MSLLQHTNSVEARLKRLGRVLRDARLALGYRKSDEFGDVVGVSGRTLRLLEASGKGSTENLVRVVAQLCPAALDRLLAELEAVEVPFTSVQEALVREESGKG